MPESLIALTEGAGKNAHTFQRVIGANTVEDDVVIQGENYLAGYLFSLSGISTATATAHLVQIMAGASLKVRVRRIEIWQTTLATTATLGLIQIMRLTTAGTGGPGMYQEQLDTSDANAGATGMSLPTVKGTESGRVVGHGVMYMMQTLTASAQLNNPVMVLDYDRPRSKPLMIASGTTSGIAIKNNTAIAGGQVAINVWLDESNF